MSVPETGKRFSNVLCISVMNGEVLDIERWLDELPVLQEEETANDLLSHALKIFNWDGDCSLPLQRPIPTLTQSRISGLPWDIHALQYVADDFASARRARPAFLVGSSQRRIQSTLHLVDDTARGRIAGVKTQPNPF